MSVNVSHRFTNASGVVICAVSLLVALFYMERVLGLKPCPLCILSRYVVVTMGIVFLLGLLDNQRYVSQLVYTGANLFWVIIGSVIALRHLWMQNHPVLSCNLEGIPGTIIDFITKAFAGTHDCSVNDWTFLSMTVPEQTLALFAVLWLLLVVQLFRCLKGARNERGSKGQRRS
jgi:protein dithiol:quinone oxidoreductase